MAVSNYRANVARHLRHHLVPTMQIHRLPPTALGPLLAASAQRTLFTRRTLTSLWNPPVKHIEVESNTPFVPPPPKINVGTTGEAGVTPASGEGVKDGAKKKEKKQRYLDSLMEKAGELSLKCKLCAVEPYRKLMIGSILDSEGSWTAEEGKYKKSEICRDHDLSVSCFDL